MGMVDMTDAVNFAAVKRDFAVNVAHELRTPLTAIKGFTETLMERAGGEDRKYLDIILRNTDRLISLVRDVQALAEMERPGYELEAEEVDLRTLIEPVIDLFRPAAKEKGLELALEPGSSVPVSGDPYRLEQLAINLLDNAIKYTDKGSIRVVVTEGDGQALLEVSDTGPGIPEADIPRLCERFYVVDRSRSRNLGGTGLGLAIVKHIVMLHEGTLNIRSQVGKGSTFSVRLPRHRGSPAS
jgi:two-component system phosphate regulon sensor histidine kinase PhoR